MGGDNAPREIVRGASEAAAAYKDAEIVLVGDAKKINEAAEENRIDMSRLTIIHTEVAITMDDPAISCVRGKPDSSMAIGLKLVRDGADAFVSAGSTAALHAGSTLIVRKLPGVARSAIATILPFPRPLLLMDSGANPVVQPEYLAQWAVMGSVYMKKLMDVESPEVGLLSNGTEEHKGTAVGVDAYRMLSESSLNFAGNIESREIPFGACDVLVTDGFTGNVVLKLVEGMGKFMFAALKQMYTKNAATKMSFLVMKDQLKAMKKAFDASEYGGAPFLGLNKPVIKAHGNSDAAAIKNAVRQAIKYAESGVTAEIAEGVKAFAPSGGRPSEEANKDE